MSSCLPKQGPAIERQFYIDCATIGETCQMGINAFGVVVCLVEQGVVYLYIGSYHLVSCSGFVSRGGFESGEYPHFPFYPDAG